MTATAHDDKAMTALGEAPLLAGRHRIRLIGICFWAGFLAIAAQLGNLTVLQGRLAGESAAAVHEDRLPRPDIVDRNGVLLAPLTAHWVAEAMLENQIDPMMAVTSPQRFGRL